MIDFFPTRAVALEVFGFSVHWYGLMYLLGFIVAYLLLPLLQRERGLSLSNDDWANILSLAVVGVIVGGRLGFVFFYEPLLILEDPFEIVQVWHGGMSSHGGFIGVTLMLLYAVRRWKISALALADIVVVPVAIGLALGRFGNYINYELYGTVTALPWGMQIPGVDGLRHPTQLYAMLKDLLIASLCFVHLHAIRPVVPGRTCALFLMLYAVLRFAVEYFRVQTYDLFSMAGIELTRGQLLTVPIFVVGLILWHSGAISRLTRRYGNIDNIRKI